MGRRELPRATSPTDPSTVNLTLYVNTPTVRSPPSTPTERRLDRQSTIAALWNTQVSCPPSTIRNSQFAVRNSQIGILQAGVHEVPVDQFVHKGRQIVRATILVVEIIGMLPHVHDQERLHPLGDRRLGIGGLDDLKFAAV